MYTWCDRSATLVLLLLLFAASVGAGIEIRYRCRLEHARVYARSQTADERSSLAGEQPDPMGLISVYQADGWVFSKMMRREDRSG